MCILHTYNNVYYVYTHTHGHEDISMYIFFFYKRVNKKCDTNLKTKRGKFGNPTSV